MYFLANKETAPDMPCRGFRPYIRLNPIQLTKSSFNPSLFLFFSLSPGPEKWGELFPLARGKRQSPIDISTQSTTKGSELAQPLQIKYVPENTRSLVNPGYCWRVDVNGKDSELTGGPLGEDKYVLEQFHCHWGSTDAKGSEHTVDGQSYAGELHLVHWNQTKYESFAEAARHPDGLAVLGVFIKVGVENNSFFVGKLYVSI